MRSKGTKIFEEKGREVEEGGGREKGRKYHGERIKGHWKLEKEIRGREEEDIGGNEDVRGERE